MASTDEAVTEDLVQTLQDGKNGFEKGAERLKSEDPTNAATFARFAEQRAAFTTELRGLAKQYGDDVDSSGGVVATLHRGWMALKDNFTGSDPKAVFEVAEQGEDHAVKVYDDALAKDISAGLRTVVERQYIDIKSAHATVRALRDANQ
jgi:uncharacterized protein (TIGR02284 family)